MTLGLALTEEVEMQAQSGDVFARYAQGTPRFIPRWPVPARTQ